MESDHDPVATVVNAMNAVGMVVPIETRILHHEDAVMLVMEPMRMANETVMEPLGMTHESVMVPFGSMEVPLMETPGVTTLEVTAPGQRHGATGVVGGPGGLGHRLART